MNIFFIFLFIFIVVTAIVGVYIFANKKQVDKIMKREDNTYTGISHNSFDIYKIYKVLKEENNLNFEELKLLKEQLFLVIIWYVFLIVYFIFMFFFDW